MERVFRRYIGIDYSGAVTPESSCRAFAFTLPHVTSVGAAITTKEKSERSVSTTLRQLA